MEFKVLMPTLNGVKVESRFGDRILIEDFPFFLDKRVKPYHSSLTGNSGCFVITEANTGMCFGCGETEQKAIDDALRAYHFYSRKERRQQMKKQLQILKKAGITVPVNAV